MEDNNTIVIREEIKDCNICGKNSSRLMKKKDMYICKSCYKKHFVPKNECSICHNIDSTEKIIDGKSICRSCYRKLFRPKRICSICNKEDFADKIINGKYICRSCYGKTFRPKRICSICNKEDFVNKIIDGKYICRSCYRKTFKPKRVCSMCNKEDIADKIIDGKYICRSCYRKTFKPKRLCSICNSYNYIDKIYNNQPICQSCYKKYFQLKKLCSICGDLGFIGKVSGNDLICIACYRKQSTLCQKCGTTIKQHDKISGLCSDCYFLEKTQLFIQTEIQFLNNVVAELYSKFYKTLIVYRSPKSTFKSLISQLYFFEYINKSNYSIDIFNYELFSYLKVEYNFSISIELENFLIRENLLVPLTELEQFIKLNECYLSKIPAAFFREYKSFLNHLVERKYKLIEKGWHEKFKLSTYEKILYCSYKLLYFLSDRIDSINELSNELLDEYFAKFQSVQNQLNYFIKWINKNVRLFKKINLTKVKQHLKIGNPYTEEEIFEIVENLNSSNRFMHKALGFLLILYGIRPYEIVKLKMSDYLKTDNGSKLFIRNVWIPLHSYVMEILDNYIEFERSDKLSFGTKVDWIFLGYKYDTHLSKKRVSDILRKYKINSVRAFSTVVSNLILDNKLAPSSVIHGTGINLYTVMSYYKVLNIDSTYNFNVNNNYKLNNKPIENKKYFIFILKCIDGTYYTGYTSDIQKRLKQHQEGTGCTYTKTRTPVELVYTEELPDKPSALKREKQIKKLTIFDKEKLIEKSRAN